LTVTQHDDRAASYDGNNELILAMSSRTASRHRTWQFTICIRWLMRCTRHMTLLGCTALYVADVLFFFVF